MDEKEVTAPAPKVVAWMNPETLDVIHDSRKASWETDFGAGGKAKAAGYTVPLIQAPV